MGNYEDSFRILVWGLNWSIQMKFQVFFDILVFFEFGRKGRK